MEGILMLLLSRSMDISTRTQQDMYNIVQLNLQTQVEQPPSDSHYYELCVHT